MKRIVKLALASVAGVALFAGAGTYGAYWWNTGRYLQSTDDAYLQADYTTIAPKVSGYIQAVLVDDNQPVKAGQILARIDERDLHTALVPRFVVALDELDLAAEHAARLVDLVDGEANTIAHADAHRRRAASERTVDADLDRIGGEGQAAAGKQGDRGGEAGEANHVLVSGSEDVAMP